MTAHHDHIPFHTKQWEQRPRGFKGCMVVRTEAVPGHARIVDRAFVETQAQMAEFLLIASPGTIHQDYVKSYPDYHVSESCIWVVSPKGWRFRYNFSTKEGFDWAVETLAHYHLLHHHQMIKTVSCSL